MRHELTVGGTTMELLELDTAGLHGLSGLAFDGTTLWSVAERKRSLVSWVVARPHADFALDVPRHHPFVLAPGDDVESLSWLDGQRFALGLEGQAEGRDSDRLLFVERERDTPSFGTVGDATLRHAEWGLRAPTNRGIEALCHAAGVLFAACEDPRQAADGRLAPFSGYHIVEKAFAHGYLRLTSGTGKISAIECGLEAGRLRFFAIERHYGVLRILRWELPGDWFSTTRASTVPVLDRSPIVSEILFELDGKLPPDANAEGLAWLRERNELLVVTDNQSATVTGPSRLLRVPLGASGAE